MTTLIGTSGPDEAHGARRRGGRRAFSLIELLIVIAILLALFGIVVVSYIGVKDRADVDLQRAQIETIDNAMKLFRVHMRRWPSQDEGIEVLWNRELIEDDADLSKWQGPYLEDPIRADTWGNPFVYYFPSEIFPDSDRYDLISIGPDGEEGTDDDITNHDSLKNAEGEFDDAFDDFTAPEMPGGGGS